MTHETSLSPIRRLAICILDQLIKRLEPAYLALPEDDLRFNGAHAVDGMVAELVAPDPIRRLYCTCCGAVTRGRQFNNQDTGFGLCVDCSNWIPTRPGHTMTPEEMAKTYGTRGYHFDITI